MSRRRTALDSARHVEAVDVSKQVDDVLGLPEHLRDALWRSSRRSWSEADAPAG